MKGLVKAEVKGRGSWQRQGGRRQGSKSQEVLGKDTMQRDKAKGRGEGTRRRQEVKAQGEEIR